MKKAVYALRVAICALLMLSALVFAAIEGWQLASADWALFENHRLVLVQTTARLIMALYCFGICLNAVLRKKQSFAWEGLRLLAVALAAAPFVSNYLGWAVACPALLLLISDPCVWRFLLRLPTKAC